MNKLFGPACFPLDKTVKNWKSFLTESLEEIKAKELKAQNPEWLEVISAIQQKVEPKYVHLLFNYVKKNRPDKKIGPMALDGLAVQIQKFDKLLKTGAWDRAAKSDVADEEMKNPDWWIKHDVPWNNFINYLDLVEKDFGESEKQKRTAAKSDSELVYEDERFYIISPLSHKASCFFGKGTKWCITMRDSQYWDSYTSQNKFFIFVIDSKSPEPAVAGKIAFAKDILDKRYEEIYDATDDLIDRPEWLLGMWGVEGGGTQEGEKILSIVNKYAEERRAKELPKFREKGLFFVGDKIKIAPYILERIRTSGEKNLSSAVSEVLGNHVGSWVKNYFEGSSIRELAAVRFRVEVTDFEGVKDGAVYLLGALDADGNQTGREFSLFDNVPEDRRFELADE